MVVLKLKASALIEVIISMLLISLAFAVVMIVLLNISQSYTIKEKIIALSVLNAEIDAIKSAIDKKVIIGLFISLKI